jgi:DNA-binding transcriptional MerR regulator
MPRAVPAPGDSDRARLAQAARLAGVSVQTLQYYMMVGLIEADAMSGGRQRLFDARTIRKVRMIHLLNRSGYTLRDIREIFIQPRRKQR